MKAASNIVSGILSIKQAYDHFEVFGFEHPDSKGEKLFSNYGRKLHCIIDYKTMYKALILSSFMIAITRRKYYHRRYKKQIKMVCRLKNIDMLDSREYYEKEIELFQNRINKYDIINNL
jgi:hypothetical protein